MNRQGNDIRSNGVENQSDIHIMQTENMIACDTVGLWSASLIVSFCIFVSVAYVAGGLIILMTSYGVEGKLDCPQSDIWLYALISVFFHGISLSFAGLICNPASRENKTILELSFCCMFSIEVAMIFWGGVEIFKIACASLHATSIFIFSMVSFIKQLWTLLFIIMFPCVVPLIRPVFETFPPFQSPIVALYAHDRHQLRHLERNENRSGFSGEEEMKAASSHSNQSEAASLHSQQQLNNIPMILNDRDRIPRTDDSVASPNIVYM